MFLKDLQIDFNKIFFALLLPCIAYQTSGASEVNPAKKIKIGCEVFIIKDNALLLGKRKNCFGEGTWGLPGGHLEYGETIIDGAKRELKEELGIDGLELKLVSVVDNINERTHYVHMSFLLNRFEGEIQCMEPEQCYEWRFFDLANLPQEIFVPHQKIIKNFLQRTLYFEKN